MNRNVVITGGSKGIGNACIEAFLRQNDTVVFCDLDEVASALCLSELMTLGRLYYFPDASYITGVSLIVDGERHLL